MVSQTRQREMSKPVCLHGCAQSYAVLREHNPPPKGGVPNFRRMAELLGFAPVLDVNIIPAHPFDPHASALALSSRLQASFPIDAIATCLGPALIQ